MATESWTLSLRDRLGLCWRILRAEPSNLVAHAERELPHYADGMQIKEMILVFSTQGHSGFSASYARQTLHELLGYEPLGPLTGADDEWTEVADTPDMKWQNCRCSHVFKRPDGTAYDANGRVFREPDGNCYTGAGSRVEVTFPYVPTVEYVDRPQSEG